MRGSIRQKADGWELRVGIGHDIHSGKYRQVSRYYVGTKTEANRELRNLIREVEAGQVQIAGGPTFGQLLERWLIRVHKRLSPTTIRTYRGYIDREIRPSLGLVACSKLTTKKINDFYWHLDEEKHLRPATVRQIHAIVRRALAYGVTEEYGGLKVNPAIGATLPQRVTSEIRPPHPAVVAQLLDAATDMDPGFGMVCRLAASSGARRGELCALRWDDLMGDVLTVRRSQAVVAPGVLAEKSTKTHQIRKVTVDKLTASLLEEWQMFVAGRAYDALGIELPGQAYMFSRTPDGAEPLHPDALTASWRRVCKAVGVDCRFHDLRHFNATRLLAAGVPVRTVSGRLGHGKTSTTLDIYAHWVPESDNEAAMVMGGILGGGDNGVDHHPDADIRNALPAVVLPAADPAAQEGG